MISYEPKDADKGGCWPEGEYIATLVTVEEKQSKAGNDMYVLTLDIHGETEDQFITIKEYVVIPSFVWKLRYVADALGVRRLFENGSFNPSAFLQSDVRVLLGVESRDGYRDRNVISQFLPKADPNQIEMVPASASAHPLNIEDDADLPF